MPVWLESDPGKSGRVERRLAETPATPIAIAASRFNNTRCAPAGEHDGWIPSGPPIIAKIWLRWSGVD